MTTTKLSLINKEDRRVGRTVLGFLTAPLGLLLGMGLFIAF